MIRRGWRNEGWRHSLAARGIKTNSSYFGMKDRMKKLLDDGSNPTKHSDVPKFAAESRLQMAEAIRAEANQELLAAERRGDVTFQQIEDFWERDFRQEFEDFKDKRKTAEQFRADVRTKIKRVTQPVKVAGVSNEELPSMIPGSEKR